MTETNQPSGAPLHKARQTSRTRAAPLVHADEASWPWVQGKTDRSVLTPMQLALAMQALGLTPRKLASMFALRVSWVRGWLMQDTLTGRHPMPVGVSEYVRLSVAHRLTAVASGLNVAMVTELDYAPANLTQEERTALDAIQISTNKRGLGTLTETLKGLGLLKLEEPAEIKTVQELARTMQQRQKTVDRAKELSTLARRLHLFAKSAPRS